MRADAKSALTTIAIPAQNLYSWRKVVLDKEPSKFDTGLVEAKPRQFVSVVTTSDVLKRKEFRLRLIATGTSRGVSTIVFHSQSKKNGITPIAPFTMTYYTIILDSTIESNFHTGFSAADTESHGQAPHPYRRIMGRRPFSIRQSSRSRRFLRELIRPIRVGYFGSPCNRV